MSLTDAQMQRAAAEFAANLEAAGLSRDRLRERAGLPPARFESAFTMAGRPDPVDVWLVRDTLETAVAENGGTLTPFSSMPESMRSAAAGWFGVTDRR